MADFTLNPDVATQLLQEAIDKAGRPAAERIAQRIRDTAPHGLEVDVRELRRQMRRGGERPVLSVGVGAAGALKAEAETGFITRALNSEGGY
jgi:hypothetical protein